MKMPFSGMDPYMEHPVLWEGFHARLIPIIANQLQPRLDPRYVTSVEERVFIEGPGRRIPDVWIQQVQESGEALAVAELDVDTGVELEVEELEIHQKRVEILDMYNGMKLVAIIEVVSPTNKTAGPGRRSYVEKQQEALARDCHLIEIDLLRRGRHVLSIPKWRVQELKPYDYLVCVNRAPTRQRFTAYSRRLRERLPRIKVPLSPPDSHVPLDIQAAVEQAYWEGRYMWRVRYDEPCEPRLSPANQQWANECWTAYRAAHQDLLPKPNPEATQKASGKVAPHGQEA